MTTWTTHSVKLHSLSNSYSFKNTLNWYTPSIRCSNNLLQGDSLVSQSDIETTTRRKLSMRILPISRKQFSKLVPQQPILKQYEAYWGVTKIDKLQRMLESFLLAYGGAWLAWFLSFMVGSFLSAIVGTGLVFNWMYTPWLFAKKMNRSLWSSSQPFHYSIMTGKISSLRKFKQKTGKTIGGVSQEYLSMVIDDEKGRELEIITHWKDEYHRLQSNISCSTILVSVNEDFSNVIHVTEVFIPSLDLWVGEYPYLKQEEFVKVFTNINQVVIQ